MNIEAQMKKLESLYRLADPNLNPNENERNAAQAAIKGTEITVFDHFSQYYIPSWKEGGGGTERPFTPSMGTPPEDNGPPAWAVPPIPEKRKPSALLRVGGVLLGVVVLLSGMLGILSVMDPAMGR